ncbi:RsmB/NOP family class I SAM-dependent RNA methyltransferase [Parashewanella spongiae]|uniref:RsmB/NOP family class I SAM-dependent RNA methyltransferase n=1 Tax=Parashewanella spongiae TaxID=342950 RepID=A0A3A6TCH2_9GAMM|nr:RsmB/NOP family class I SAM-dependent RNA methyltransferase [Parashewanella spongiae]MCL1079976.1 RsmB/NOP family class I SAM-dependent RNA methyltransferase [Parashewanella spongiae]RJY05991.1 RsmB/NOP family class I SAM-dependent RNA methyltransferase [Parashewanella spongiae]
MLKFSLSASSTQLVINVLDLVLSRGKPLDRAYSEFFSGQRLESEELARITIVTGDILRRLNLYCYLASVEPEEIERLGSRLLNVWHQFHDLELPKLEYSLPIDQKEYAIRLEEAKQNEALWDGCPEWLDELGQKSLGDSWAAERKALTFMPKRYLRVNELKGNREELATALLAEHITTKQVDGVDSALEVTSNSALFRSETFKKGLFEQQDAGSQLVAAAVDAQPGMRVIDACAGAGGKTLHIAAQMQGKGRLLAMDVEQWKLDALKQRARRNGAHNVETRIIASSKTIKRLKLSADRVLLDVPCSGLGVLKRNPDAKWRDTSERLPVLINLQKEILQSYSRMVKPGGILIYATCSIMPQENREQVDLFLENNSDFRLIEDENISPAKTGFDGFYLAKLERVS